MAYIGQPPYDAPYPAGDLVVDTFSGNNSTTAFTLSKAPLSENNTFVFISGVYQDKDQYSISGVTVTFTAAPPTGTNNIQVIQGQPSVVNSPGSSTVTYASLTSDMQGQLGNFKNKIINGDFNIWQRGTSFAAVANGTYTADRFAYGKANSSAVHTMSRSTDVPTVAQAGRLFNYSLLVDCTTVDSSVANNEVVGVYQVVEGYNFLPLAQKTFTLSFWIKATKTGTYCVAFKNLGTAGASDRSYVAEYNVSATDTWEYKTVTVSASPSAGTWDYTNSAGLIVAWALLCGSDRQTTSNAWNTGNFNATSNQVNACDSTANDFRLCGIQLEAGSTVTEFGARPFTTEVVLCQRYFYKTYNLDTAPGTSTSVGSIYCETLADGTLTRLKIFSSRLPVSMRTTPSVQIYSQTGTVDKINLYNNNASTLTLSSISNINENSLGNYLTVSTNASASATYEFNATASAEL